MKTKLISLAVAAALVAPAAVMAEATLYGKLNMSIDYVDVDSLAPGVSSMFRIGGTPGPADFEGWDINANNRSNRLGVKGSEDLGNGLKAIYQIEFQVEMADANNNVVGNQETVSMRNTYVGLASNFGTLLVGRHDTPLKLSTPRLDLFVDQLADYNFTVGFHDVRADNAIAYISPSFSGFQFSGAAVASGGSTAFGGTNTELDGIAEAYSLAGVYKNGPFYASLAYESLGKHHFQAQNASGAKDWNKWRAGLGLLNWNGFTLAGVYENWDNAPLGTIPGALLVDVPADFVAPTRFDADLWQVSAGYSFGNNMIKAMYGQNNRKTNNDGGDADRETWAVGFDHNFSKRTSAYILYTDVTENDVDDADWSGFSIGMIHSF